LPPKHSYLDISYVNYSMGVLQSTLMGVETKRKLHAQAGEYPCSAEKVLGSVKGDS
jgi:hypothetical protein